MPLTRAQQRTDDQTPHFLHLARTFYGPAFQPRRKSELAEAMADWADLAPEEQSFALAHLDYLNLLAQAENQRLLTQIRDLLEELAEQVEDAIEGEEADDEDPEGYLVAEDDNLETLESNEPHPGDEEPEEVPDGEA